MRVGGRWTVYTHNRERHTHKQKVAPGRLLPQHAGAVLGDPRVLPHVK